MYLSSDYYTKLLYIVFLIECSKQFYQDSNNFCNLKYMDCHQSIAMREVFCHMRE